MPEAIKIIVQHGVNKKGDIDRDRGCIEIQHLESQPKNNTLGKVLVSFNDHMQGSLRRCGTLLMGGRGETVLRNRSNHCKKLFMN